MIKEMIALAFVIMQIVGVLTFVFWIWGSTTCVSEANTPEEIAACTKTIIEESPPMKDVKTLEAACESSETECLYELGKRKFMGKIEKDFEENKLPT